MDDANDKEKIDFAKFIFNHNETLVSLADTKAGILLGINGIVIALLFAVDKGILIDLTKALFVITAILLGASSFFAIRTIFPRLSDEASDTNIYFKKIAARNRDEFFKSWKELDSSKILHDYLLNIHNLADIELKKFKRLQLSISLLIVAIGFLIASLFSFILG